VKDLAFNKTDRGDVRREKYYYVYMLTSSSRRALYTGVTNDLILRLQQHREGFEGFTSIQSVSSSALRAVRRYQKRDRPRKRDQGVEAGKEEFFGIGK
jgi:predicted GIY-YIG superfamily endonuclease